MHNRPTSSALPLANEKPRLKQDSSFKQILDSSSIIGGAQAINLAIGLFRTKIVAILLGPAGVGLLGAYQSVAGLLEVIAGLGVKSSAVREIAKANSGKIEAASQETIETLRILGWFSATLSIGFAVVFSVYLSSWIFATTDKATPLVIVGIAVFFSILSSTQLAILQAFRRLKEIAVIQISSAILGTISTVVALHIFGERGIAPSLVIASIVTLCCTTAYSRRFLGKPRIPAWKTFSYRARTLLSLGVAFVATAILSALVNVVLRSMIIDGQGIEANGLYQSAWSISGVFAGFILTAMGTDFYPRLSAAANDHKQMQQLVNDQVEVGVLIAVPGLALTIIFCVPIVSVLYSNRFASAAEMLPWFTIGLLGRVISWPFGFVLLAKAKSITYILSELAINSLHVLLAWLFLSRFGLVGIAIAFAVLYFFYILMIQFLAVRVIQFRWRRKSVLSAIFGISCLAFCFLTHYLLAPPFNYIAGSIAVFLISAFALRRVCSELPATHPIPRLVAMIPLSSRLIPRV